MTLIYSTTAASGAVTSAGSFVQQTLTTADRVRPRVRIRSSIYGVPVYAVPISQMQRPSVDTAVD